MSQDQRVEHLERNIPCSATHKGKIPNPLLWDCKILHRAFAVRGQAHISKTNLTQTDPEMHCSETFESTDLVFMPKYSFKKILKNTCFPPFLLKRVC